MTILVILILIWNIRNRISKKPQICLCCTSMLGFQPTNSVSTIKNYISLKVFFILMYSNFFSPQDKCQYLWKRLVVDPCQPDRWLFEENNKGELNLRQIRCAFSYSDTVTRNFRNRYKFKLNNRRKQIGR